MKLQKRERQARLSSLLEENPLLTDGDLAEHFGVSVQTIRLDRMEKGIPELRERLKDVAVRSLDDVKSLPIDEVIGDIIDIELDKRAVSVFDVTRDHVFQRNGIARGHHLFAQANSLAVAVIDDELALTAKSSLNFIKPVRAGERVVAKAAVRPGERPRRTIVEVISTVGDEPVFTGTFEMYRTHESGKEGQS
ncbi:transcription factor FapR [Bhargavaea beijingensis]|uniref:Transcription factor FapR n=1 Tax=Bhargavaea beijingensis TaxID=426756 RepID=A0A1G7C9Z8_9BACL|nr:transcription factor FapR [Bhargavaea beijingensis]MCW1926903.1 transcription factor FapR [Bhargavaea beijingensis]RSK36853.1 transcription factor FapR [Bhargavaea beijingensis]SDE36149.1 Acyl-coenzyme A thioesterase PaaI, contains HGG motif [Bhargavaea beijingensis]